MIYKLQKGQNVVITVTKVVPEVPATNPRYGPSTKFAGHTESDPDACIFLTPATAERQLARHGLTLDTAVGRTLEFAKPGEYIDINLPPGVVAPPALTPPPAAAPATAPAAAGATNAKQGFSAGPAIPGLDAPAAPPAPASNGAAESPDDLSAGQLGQMKKIAGLHRRCLQFVIQHEIPLLDGPQIGASPEAVSALTAQLFIAATNAGLHR